MLARRAATLDEYVSSLEREPGERRALVEDIVVSETWFFRDEQVFRTLIQKAHAVLRAKGAREPLRILSMPCATGEEPYSVAVALLASGVPRDRFRIHAVDVSARALERAEQATYGRNSFRGVNSRERMQYFEPAGEELRVSALVKAQVSFASGNILDTLPPWGKGTFDVILCRNLLIYLDRAARSRAIDNLLRWLAPDGVLFAGHAEALDGMDARLQRLEGGTHFAFVRRGGTSPTPSVPASEAGHGARTRRGLEQTSRRPSFEPSRQPPKSLTPKPAPSPAVTGLERATELANRGELAEAASACERHLAEAGADAATYHLLGIIRQASADAESALECFNKALYVNPAHYESMVHLALLHEKRGEHAQAQNLRRRAERAAKKREAP
jgi:chemotaxis protein methyltransferase WspC